MGLVTKIEWVMVGTMLFAVSLWIFGTATNVVCYQNRVTIAYSIVNKCVSINEFLNPAEGEKYYNPGGRGRGLGRGGRGDRKALHEAHEQEIRQKQERLYREREQREREEKERERRRLEATREARERAAADARLRV
ncbi:hypothetical protein IFM89_020001 [Coptis chinensis]|uniref:Uncharacterized protein n=1 Tax=Coptis chinensis TaxID=261450 RepID=A0A835M481_9MAGN|nr:hypothetical protein IFM89_020001 [Coptis chinensis]